MNFNESRQKIIDWLRENLIGPGSALDGESDDYNLRGRQPTDRYYTGVLFPVVKGEMGLDPASEDSDDEDTGEEAGAAQAKSAQKPRRYAPPASVGFSFFIRGDRPAFQVHAWAVKYVREGKPDKHGIYHDERGKFLHAWVRKPLCPRDSETKNIQAPATREKREESSPVLGDHAKLHILWRPIDDGWLTTI